MTNQRTVTRRFTAEVEFHHVDMMQVVHNSQYLKWFEKGRFILFEDVFPMSWAIENKIATPVITNHCEYLSPARFGDKLAVTTRHRLTDVWDGKFLFDHSISNAKTKVELCCGHTAVTVVDLNSHSLVKEIPDDVWIRYQALK
ncbi:MAG: hypothetical protein GY847_40760 [Proteobacteria bacterium]|nr:hypothetical protein [Pseudomonadota bacterium]